MDHPKSGYKIDPDKLLAIGRMGGPTYTPPAPLQHAAAQTGVLRSGQTGFTQSIPRLPPRRHRKNTADCPGGDYKQFLTAYLEEQGLGVPESAGEVVASNGEAMGRHEGIFNFTVGQRKGLGLASPSPLYVLNIDPKSHRVTVGADAELATRTLRARRLNWISIAELTGPMRVRAKIRHRHEPAWATLEPAGADEAVATFDEPQRAVTPGQSAVFYDGDEVVGGGWIV